MQNQTDVLPKIKNKSENINTNIKSIREILVAILGNNADLSKAILGVRDEKYIFAARFVINIFNSFSALTKEVFGTLSRSQAYNIFEKIVYFCQSIIVEQNSIECQIVAMELLLSCAYQFRKDGNNFAAFSIFSALQMNDNVGFAWTYNLSQHGGYIYNDLKQLFGIKRDNIKKTQQDFIKDKLNLIVSEQSKERRWMLSNPTQKNLALNIIDALGFFENSLIQTDIKTKISEFKPARSSIMKNRDAIHDEIDKIIERLKLANILKNHEAKKIIIEFILRGESVPEYKPSVWKKILGAGSTKDLLIELDLEINRVPTNKIKIKELLRNINVNRDDKTLDLMIEKITNYNDRLKKIHDSVKALEVSESNNFNNKFVDYPVVVSQINDEKPNIQTKPEVLLEQKIEKTVFIKLFDCIFKYINDYLSADISEQEKLDYKFTNEVQAIIGGISEENQDYIVDAVSMLSSLVVDGSSIREAAEHVFEGINEKFNVQLNVDNFSLLKVENKQAIEAANIALIMAQNISHRVDSDAINAWVENQIATISALGDRIKVMQFGKLVTEINKVTRDLFTFIEGQGLTSDAIQELAKAIIVFLWKRTILSDDSKKHDTVESLIIGIIAHPSVSSIILKELMQIVQSVIAYDEALAEQKNVNIKMQELLNKMRAVLNEKDRSIVTYAGMFKRPSSDKKK